MSEKAPPSGKIRRRRRTRWKTKRRRYKRRNGMLYYVPHGVAVHAIMVDYNSKERGVRIGDTRVRGLSVGCLNCQHHTNIEMADALATFGNAYARDVAQRLRCTRCNERKGYVHVWAEARPKP